MFLLTGQQARMCGCGIHYALPSEWVDPAYLDRASVVQLRGFTESLKDRFQELCDQGWTLNTEKAWHLIHRCLTDGTLDSGFTVGHLCILGTTDAYWFEQEDGQVDWIVNLLTPLEVCEVATFLQNISPIELRQRYDRIDPMVCDYEPWEEDWVSIVNSFLPLQTFFTRASAAGRWIVFVARGPRESN